MSPVDRQPAAAQAPDDAFLRQLYREAPLGIARISLDGLLLEVNPRLCALLGRTAADLAGRSLFEIGHDSGQVMGQDSEPSAASEGLRQLRQGAVERCAFDLCCCRPAAGEIWLRLSIASVRPAAGPACAGIALFEDIDARKGLEADAAAQLSMERSQHRREVRQLIDADRLSRERAGELHGMLVQISETTLRQVGQELHDDVGQILAGAAMLAGTMARTLAQHRQAEAPLASQLTGLLNGAVGKLRAVSRGLFPIGLESAGLRAMLDALAMQLRASSALAIELQHDGSTPPLSDEQALQIYRIVQEATSNVLRHSAARTLRMTFNSWPGALSVTVADDGFGIERDRRQRGGGIGLRTMHARAARIGASLHIHSPAEGGTRVELELPLPAQAPLAATA